MARRQARGPLRRRDVLLALPILSIAGVVICTVRNTRFGWSAMWIIFAGLAIAAYLAPEQRRPRP